MLSVKVLLGGDEGADFYCSVAFQDGTALGQLYRLIHARGVEYQKALDEILHLNERAVTNGLGLAPDHLTRSTNRSPS
jgi:hypothetical protein